MPYFFVCPKCNSKNYLKKDYPEPDKFKENLKCMRCDLKGIYWVQNEATAKLLAQQLKVPLTMIAIGVGESSIGSKKDEDILERLKPSELKAPYSQGQRTKEFSPGTQAVKEGVCEGQCLHWIRRVLQGGRETYETAPDLPMEETVLRQKRQHTVGAAAQIVLGKALESVNARNKTTLGDPVAIGQKVEAEISEMKVKFEAILSTMGFKKVGHQWSVPSSRDAEYEEAWNKWDAFESAKRKELKERLASLSRSHELKEEQGFYATSWEGFAKDLDRWVAKNVKNRKRPFSNIVVVKSTSLKAYASVGDFVRRIVNDADFCEGTCAVLSVGIKGVGEAGGSINSHAIAVHFKDSQELFVFDPNIGILKTGSKWELQRTVETVIGTVWPQDFNWELKKEFGYALFRKRDHKIETNTEERRVPFAASPQFTAAENKALGHLPAKTRPKT